MNTTGTASHFKRMAAMMAIINSIIFGKLFFRLRSLNFRAIKGSVETINPLTKIITAYRTHLLVSHSLTFIMPLSKWRISGKEAINKLAKVSEQLDDLLDFSDDDDDLIEISKYQVLLNQLQQKIIGLNGQAL